MTSILTPTENTPSKAVTASFNKFALDTPIKKPVFDTKSKESVPVKSTDAPNATEGKVEPLDPDRLRFVGDVDLDEKDEPLLKESKRRFVLFPIQYNEVSSSF